MNFNVSKASLNDSNVELDLYKSTESVGVGKGPEGNGLEIRCMEFLDQKGFLFVAGEQGNVFQYQFKDGTLLFVKRYRNIHSSDISELKLSADGKSLFSADASGSLKKIGIAQETLLKSYGNVIDGKVTGVELVC